MKSTGTVRNQQERAGGSRIDAEIEQMLATEEALTPSSGFLASVMERIQEEATAPAPIPFPWKRFFPGIVLASVVFGWGGVELIRVGLPAMQTITFPAPHLSPAYEHSLESAGWVALSLGASLVSCLLSRRLAGRGGML